MSKKKSVQKEQVPDSKSQRLYRFLPLIILSFASVLTILAYIRSLNGPLVLDDSIFIDQGRLQHVLDSFRVRMRKVAEISFAFNYMISGMSIPWFRITNIVLHILTSMMAFYFTYLTLTMPSMKDRFGKSSPVISTAVAVLFMLHPIQTATVNYVTQRMALMAAMFSFSGVILYAKAGFNRGKKALLYYALSAVSFVFALFSKENAVMVLLMLPVYDYMFISAFRWKEFIKKFKPLSILLVVLGVIVAYYMRAVGFIEKIIGILSNPDQPIVSYKWAGIGIDWTAIEYLFTELRIVSRYIFLILFPNPSSMVFDYSNAYPVSKSLFNPVSTLFSLLFLLVLFLFSVRYIKKFPLISFGILWYLVTISLESFIALGLDPYFEHRNYLPGLGLFIAFASFLVYGDKFRIKKWILISVVASLLCIMTFMRNGVWTEEYILWKDAYDKAPTNPRALIALSSACIKEGKYREAEELLESARKTQSSINEEFKFSILSNQASLYQATGRMTEAVIIAKDLLSGESIKNVQLSKMQISNLTFMIGETLREEGKVAEAKEYLLKAYALNKRNPSLLISLGFASKSLREMEEAEKYFRSANEISPTQFIPYIELGDIYFVKGDLNEAERLYKDGLARAPVSFKEIQKKVYQHLAQIKLAKGETSESAELFKKVIENDPGFYAPYIFLGDIYLRSGNPDQALFYLEKALSLRDTFVKGDPNAKLVYFHLGMVYSKKGDKQLAKKNLQLFMSLAGSSETFVSYVEKAKEKLAQINE